MSEQSEGEMRWIAVQEQANEKRRQHPEWRLGQALFNALHDVDPHLANQIRGTAADPFYDSPESIAVFGRAVIAGSDQA